MGASPSELCERELENEETKHWLEQETLFWTRAHLTPGGPSQPLVQMHGCSLHSCQSDLVAMLQSKKCVCVLKY